MERIILISSARLIFLIYFKSHSSLSSQLIVFRPFTCASPLSPGFAVCLILCSSVIKTMSRTSCGRGPITDIVPLKILNASGSSSKLVFLSHLPNLVSLTSSESSSPFSSRSSVIVLNLYILKTVSLPSFPINPGRSCVKRTGEPSLSFTSTATPR